MGPPPIVTGISPKEGPPGTRVTIRGEFLGNGPNDLIGLTICGCDCHLSAEWKSSNKIIGRSGPGKGKGDIIVTTRSGGRGTSTVQFRGYYETIGPTKESAVWVEEAPQNLIWGRRSLSPTSYQQEDPLGLSVEGESKKFPEDDLHELFPEGSGDLTSKQFVPGWFLLENHQTTSFDDLKAGLAFLRRKVDSQKEGQLSFLKANVGSVMDQLDTLLILKERFEADMKELGPDPTAKLENVIKESMLEAKKLFDDVLARRERADATRNALGVMQRNKFLFNLPVSIERNIRKGEYDVVINDYSRAKNLFSKTDVAIFKKVLAEVEVRINNLREILHIKLQEMPSSLEEQKKIIRNLVNLESTGDPAWDAICCHSKYISKQLNSCKEEHIAADSILGEEIGKGQKTQNVMSNKYNKGNNGNNSQVQDWQISVPQRVLCVEELTEIISNTFPDMWKLGQAYFTGDLHVKVDVGRQNQFKSMVLTSIEQFTGILRAAILVHTLDRQTIQKQSYGVWPSQNQDNVVLWLPHCLRYVRSMYSTLIRLDLPNEALDIISSLIFDLRLHSMSTLFQQASEHIKSLHSKETWKVEFDSKHGGITELPAMFETKVQEVVQLVKESVLLSEQRETSLLENHTAQRELNALIQDVLLSFSKALEKLTNSNDAMSDDDVAVVSQLIGSPFCRNNEVDGHTPVWEQRLLMTLSNCRYTSQVTLPRLSELFVKYGFPPPILPVATAVSCLESLERQILETYLEQKCDPLVGTIEPSMYLGRFDWDTTSKPHDVRPYAKEIITNIIGVHAEVHRVSSSLVSRVLMQIVETVAEELARLMSCVTRFSVEGNQQARADICAVQETLKNYTTTVAQGFFEEALEAIPPITSEKDKQVVEDILHKFRTNMRFQLLCFSDSKQQHII